ncbi:hypothetical protein [Actinocrispum sp. NPDC049592]|uniref:hypothetical protein n=1 Tax=Actinocrispum sp. NPDC049592 TaxID=3154835 RepID=UPI0034422717
MTDTPVAAEVSAIQCRLALEMPRWLDDQDGEIRVRLTELAVVVYEIAQDTARREVGHRYQVLAACMRLSGKVVGLPDQTRAALDRWAHSIARRASTLLTDSRPGSPPGAATSPADNREGGHGDDYPAG